MEDEIVKGFKPIFDKRYVEDPYVKRKCNKTDTLYDVLNPYHKVYIRAKP